MNLLQFILSLTERGQEFTLVSFGDRIWVEVGKYGYVFNRFGKSMGGWVYRPESDEDWDGWQRLLME